MYIVDHVNSPVSGLLHSRRFCERVLVTLGYRFLMQDGGTSHVSESKIGALES